MRVPFASALLVIISGCSSPSAMSDGGLVADPVRAEFASHYDVWQIAIAEPPLALNSDVSSYTEHAQFREIVSMGKRALPLVMEKIEQGDMFMNEAAKQITHVDIEAELRARPDKSWGPGNPPLGARDVSASWIKWWQAHKQDPQWQP